MNDVMEILYMVIDMHEPSEQVESSILAQARRAVAELTNESSMGYIDHYRKANGRYLEQEYPGLLEIGYVPELVGYAWVIVPEITWGDLYELVSEAYELNLYGDTGNWSEVFREIVEEAREAELRDRYGDDVDIQTINVYEEEHEPEGFDYELSEYGYFFTSHAQLYRMEEALGISARQGA